MNPVDHPGGGDNDQHIRKALIVPCFTVPGQKVGLIAALQTDLLRSTVKVKEVLRGQMAFFLHITRHA
ncbi:hypothetical protein EDB19DRAFT_1717352 [Suillus lakei]|nr:hypothetical protein EDB19DRAFT_1717352 [Suillus lakei]